MRTLDYIKLAIAFKLQNATQVSAAIASGNSLTATTLQTARAINGISFNGSADITVTAAASTLTGNTLASGITASSLTSVGTLSSLTASGAVTGASLVPTGTSIPTNGVYLPAPNTVAIATNDTERFRVDAAGNIGTGGATVPTVGATQVLGVGNGSGGTFAWLQSNAIVFRISGTTSGVDVFNPNNTPVAIYTDGVARLTITGDGTITPAKGFAPDAGGLKHTRVTTGSIPASSTVLVTVTWGTAFADANYTVQASVLDSTTTSLSLSVVHVESVSASAVTVRVLNNAAGALTGTLHVMAIHD